MYENTTSNYSHYLIDRLALKKMGAII